MGQFCVCVVAAVWQWVCCHEAHEGRQDMCCQLTGDAGMAVEWWCCGRAVFGCASVQQETSMSRHKLQSVVEVERWCRSIVAKKQVAWSPHPLMSVHRLHAWLCRLHGTKSCVCFLLWWSPQAQCGLIELSFLSLGHMHGKHGKHLCQRLAVRCNTYAVLRLCSDCLWECMPSVLGRLTS